MANVAQAKFNFKKGYGENFKQLRLSKGLKLTELGKILHYSDRTLSMIETENRTPTNEQLIAYHDYFHVSYEYLLGETSVSQLSVQDICELTGLSESAISVLTRLKEKKDYRAYSDLLSIIITNPDFEYFLGLIESSIVSENQCNKRLDSFSIVDFSDRELASFALNRFIPQWIEQISKGFLSSYLPSEFRTVITTFERMKNKVISEYKNGQINEEEKEKRINTIEADFITDQRKYSEKYDRIIKGE